MEKIEEYMADAVYVMVSKSSYDLLQKYKQQEIAEQNESRLKTIKSDNTGVYRVRELMLRGFIRVDDFWIKDEHRIPHHLTNNKTTDSKWFSLMDKLDNK